MKFLKNFLDFYINILYIIKGDIMKIKKYFENKDNGAVVFMSYYEKDEESMQGIIENLTSMGEKECSKWRYWRLKIKYTISEWIYEWFEKKTYVK